MTESTVAVHFEYDDPSRRVLVTYENGSQCAYAYSIGNDLTALAHTFTGSSVGFEFSYTKVHQVNSMSSSNSQYVWTPAMSRSTVYSAANNLNQYPAVAGAALTYNENGCQTGGSISGSALAASYDELNRITEASLGAVTNEYLWDPLNRQAQKELDSVKTGFLYDGQQLIEEYDNEGDLANRYVRGNRLDEIYIKIAASGGTKTYLHHDRLGSVIALTDEAGAVVESCAYGPFGETRSPMSGTAFGFTGQRYDSEIALYNYKARYYNPAAGRFLQPDPIGFDAGDLNLYAYVGNDGVNLVDSSGLQAFGIPGCNAGIQVGQKAASYAGRTSRLFGKEFGGLMYQDAWGGWHSTPLMTSGLDKFLDLDQSHSLVPFGLEVQGEFHGHPVYSNQNPIVGMSRAVTGTGFLGAQVSPYSPEDPSAGSLVSAFDMQNAMVRNRTSFVGTSSALVRMFNGQGVFSLQGIGELDAGMSGLVGSPTLNAQGYVLNSILLPERQ